MGEKQGSDLAQVVDGLLVNMAMAGGEWKLVSRHERRTCEILVVDYPAGTGDERLVVKRFFESHSDLGRRSLQALDMARQSLAGVLAPGFDVTVVQGRSATTDPPALAMTYATGVDLHETLASSTSSELFDLRPVLFAAGRVLAALHDRWPNANDGDEVTPDGLLEPLRRQLRLRDTTLAQYRDAVRPVPSMIDFAPNNLRVGDSSLVVLDPPLLDRTVTRHEDLAHFLGQVRHHLVRNPALRRKEIAALQHQLAAEFLEGYLTTAVGAEWTSSDDDLVAMFATARSTVWAIKHWRRSQRGSAIRLGTVAAAARVSRRSRRRAFLGA